MNEFSGNRMFCFRHISKTLSESVLNNLLEVCTWYLASVEALEKDHSHGPDVHLVGDFRRLLAHHKTLWRKIPDTQCNQGHTMSKLLDSSLIIS